MRKDLLVIIAVFIIVATAWNVLIPPYENLDEIEHAEVVRHIAVTGRLPVHGEAEAAGYHVRQEASQPPLYHILAAGWSRLWQLPVDPHAPKPIPGNVVACGPSDTFYNKATWTRDPAQERFPWAGALRTLHAVRFFSTLLQVATVAGSWTLARRVFPHGPAPFLATTLVAFNPQFLLVASGVNNDNAVTPLATWGLVLAYDLWDKGPTLRRVLLFGALSGLAGLSKLSGLGLVGMGGLALLIRTWQQKAPLRDLVKWSALLILPALLILTPWLGRNLRLYGDPTALAPMLEKVGRRTYPIAISEIVPMVLSYWGQMPCSFYPRALYWPYLALMAGGLAGIAFGWRRFNRQQKLALSLASTWFIVIVLAWLRWNAITPATGGRLLFPAIASLALVLAAGWRALTPRIAQIWAALLSILAIVTLVAGPVTLFAPPPHLPDDAQVPNPLNVTFGEVITLRGYKAHVIEPRLACALASSSYCSPALDVTLYWQAIQPISENLTLALQLVSPVPGKTDLRLNYHHWPGHGNLPTEIWWETSEGTILQDRYVLPIPESDAATQAWALQVALVDDEIDIRQQVYDNSTSIGDAARLALLRVEGEGPIPRGERNPATPVQFGTFARLEDAYFANESVILYWSSLQTPPENYTVFVHGYSADGELIASGDGPPQNGHFPTSLWATDDSVLDAHRLALPEDGTVTRIAVGLYSPVTGERVPATYGESPLPDNAVVIWEAQP